MATPAELALTRKRAALAAIDEAGNDPNLLETGHEADVAENKLALQQQAAITLLKELGESAPPNNRMGRGRVRLFLLEAIRTEEEALAPIPVERLIGPPPPPAPHPPPEPPGGFDSVSGSFAPEIEDDEQVKVARKLSLMDDLLAGQEALSATSVGSDAWADAVSDVFGKISAAGKIMGELGHPIADVEVDPDNIAGTLATVLARVRQALIDEGAGAPSPFRRTPPLFAPPRPPPPKPPRKAPAAPTRKKRIIHDPRTGDQTFTDDPLPQGWREGPRPVTSRSLRRSAADEATRLAAIGRVPFGRRAVFPPPHVPIRHEGGGLFFT